MFSTVREGGFVFGRGSSPPLLLQRGAAGQPCCYSWWGRELRDGENKA